MSSPTAKPLQASSGPAKSPVSQNERVHSKTKLATRKLLCFGTYLLLILFPIVVSWLKHPPEVEGRSFSLQFSAACGYVALGIMAFEFSLISRVGFIASAFGQDALLKFHRQMGVVAAALILLHVVFVFKNGYPVTWLIPLENGTVQWGALALYSLSLLIILSIGRKQLKLPYGWWQLTHSFLANLILLFVAYTH